MNLANTPHGDKQYVINQTENKCNLQGLRQNSCTNPTHSIKARNR